MIATSENRRDALVQRAAESLRGPGRAERLGTALAALARELADARQEIARLKRENAALRARLERDGDERGAAVGDRRPPDRLQPWAGIGQHRGG